MKTTVRTCGMERRTLLNLAQGFMTVVTEDSEFQTTEDWCRSTSGKQWRLQWWAYTQTAALRQHWVDMLPKIDEQICHRPSQCFTVDITCHMPIRHIFLFFFAITTSPTHKFICDFMEFIVTLLPCFSFSALSFLFLLCSPFFLNSFMSLWFVCGCDQWCGMTDGN